jgi:hypothetical protein
MVSVAQAQGHMWMRKQGQAKQPPDPVIADNVRLLQSSPQILSRVEDAARRLRDLEQAHEDQAPGRGQPGTGRPRATPRPREPRERSAPDKT